VELVLEAPLAGVVVRRRRDVHPACPVYACGAKRPASETDAIDVVYENLYAPAAVHHVGEGAADAPFDVEIPGSIGLNYADPLVLCRVGHVHVDAAAQPRWWRKVRCRRDEPLDEREALPLRTGGPWQWCCHLILLSEAARPELDLSSAAGRLGAR